MILKQQHNGGRTKRNSLAVLFITAVTGLLIASCAEEAYTPKPRGYFRIDLPERIYADFVSDYCPCTFSYPAYGAVERKTSFFDEKPDHPCWMNIDMPYFNGKLHMSYMEISSGDKLERVINDSYKYAFKHSIKADFIDEMTIMEDDLYAVLFDIGGNVASSLQFFATDSTQHYLRGSLYFNEQPNADSLQPVIDFIRHDLLALMRSIEWEG